MPVSAAVFAALLAFATPAPPPSLFSPWYAEALENILDLEEAGAANLERALAANPGDLRARLQLMAYHGRADRRTRGGDRLRRVRHTLWFIERHPDSEVLHSYVARFDAGEIPAPEYGRATALWAAATKAQTSNAAVQYNAACFFEGLDPALAMGYLEATAAADPNHPHALRPLAFLYARSILEPGPLTARAQAALDASKNVWVLGNAAYFFQSMHNLSLQRGVPEQRAAALAERIFLRAKTLDPKLDRNAIVPQLESAPPPPPPSAGEWDKQAREAAGKIRRLPIDAFPELPPSVAAVLRARRCTIPQPEPGGAPRNVIRGEFFAKGETGWAALCSVQSLTTLLVFRNASDGKPEALFAGEDRDYAEEGAGGAARYLREIRAVGRDFIMRHFRAYGGPEPPPITHHGIDDAFLEKASVTWYFHNGKWLRLQGAD